MKPSNKSSLKTPLLTTPVLFLVFNRLETTQKVFAEIRKAKPKQLFIASDGPRKNKIGEKEKVEEIRKWILKNINWKCEVKTLFRKKNLGCKYAVSGAINWFFDKVEQGIILEDDCLPDQSFFRFCQELLEKYKDEEKVMSISGTNFIQRKTKDIEESYYFSRNVHIWGWASWRRAWRHYSVNNYKSLNYKDIMKNSKGLIEMVQLSKKLYDLRKSKVNTWDYQLDFMIKGRKGLNIIPYKNLVENIGLLQDSFTNAKPNKSDLRSLYLEREEMVFPLIHPKQIKQNKTFDKKFLVNDLKRVILKKLI